MKNLNDVFNSVDEVFGSAKRSAGLDEVLQKTKKYAKKSAEAIEVSRKKIELLDAKTKLAKAYENFGRLQFSAYEGESVSDDSINAAVDEITLLKNRVSFLDDEIEAFKETIAAGFDAKMNVSKSDDIIIDEARVNSEDTNE